MEIFIIAVILAVFIEGFITHLFGDYEAQGEPWSSCGRKYIKYVSLGFGILLCIAYQIDVFAALGVVSPLPFIGNIMSGLVIGRGSNYVNDFVGFARKA